jgi:hypothetical protein
MNPLPFYPPVQDSRAKTVLIEQTGDVPLLKQVLLYNGRVPIRGTLPSLLSGHAVFLLPGSYHTLRKTCIPSEAGHTYSRYASLVPCAIPD